MNGCAFLAWLAGGAFDDLGDLGFTDLQEIVRLVGEQHGFEPELLAEFN